MPRRKYKLMKPSDGFFLTFKLQLTYKQTKESFVMKHHKFVIMSRSSVRFYFHSFIIVTRVLKFRVSHGIFCKYCGNGWESYIKNKKIYICMSTQTVTVKHYTLLTNRVLSHYAAHYLITIVVIHHRKQLTSVLPSEVLTENIGHWIF